MFRKHFKGLVSRWYEKKPGLIVYVYDVSVDYDAIAVSDVLGIHKYLMKRNDAT